MLTPEELAEIRRLVELAIPIRTIARRLGRDPKTIRRALARPARPPCPAKLAPYLDLVREKAAKGLRSPRILRELRARGYQGGKTILKDFLRTLAPPRPARRVFRRFETKIAHAGQADWSPYRVLIAGSETVLHAFALVLCASRRLFVRCFKNERLPTLLWGHQEAFEYHAGVPRTIAYDNQTAISLGRVKGKPLWNPPFLDFAKAYGFTPLVGKPRNKERRGKVERIFGYFETDFLPDRKFASWDDLHGQVREWLDTVANVRFHETLRRHVHEAYAEEKPCLIALPSVRYPAERRETRKVQKDGYVPVDGSFDPAPAALVGQWVTVRIYPHRVEILDGVGEIAAAHAIPDRPARLPTPQPPPAGAGAEISRSAQEARFLARFPAAGAFLEGLKRRMTSLTPIHWKALERLADLDGHKPTADALERASEYRNFNARALERILERAHPTVVPEPDLDAVPLRTDAMGALDGIESGTPEDDTLDSMAPTEGDEHGQEA